ncbi:PREDICTED: RING-H2 finger protein ATL3 [Nelumbo nucifera]|uniref:RING-type E3 ubiquitin transferase n=2 Tax=Nelumbo nucifera TaxID=4432 RepID=A0A1U8AZR8_NELNU|nr:PREDICTED: RING-H2 finger protein ATL3 [Nelumbo nucifera]DAD49207.1 TPA_asm: hypothetical protein HUJ06_019144 [Nelumbo nucifera]
MAESSQEFNHKLEDSEAIELSGKIMMGAIITLFFVVVFVLCLHLYAKWFWGRRPDSRNLSGTSRRRFVFAPNPDPAHAQRRGLEPSIIRSLPVIIFHPNEFKDGLECAVCLCELSDGEKARILPKCNHGFHVDCIDMWFQSHSTCPLCRNTVAPESSIPGSEAPEIQSVDSNSGSGYLTESPNFPTNILFWGNQTQVSTGGSGTEGPSSLSPSVPNSGRGGALVIEIPRRLTEGFSSVSPSPSTNRFSEEETRSPMTTRLRSLKRLLSRDKRVLPCGPHSVDLEQGEGEKGQCSKTTSAS